MGRELKTKIPTLITAAEQDWQILMREREAMRKLKSNENTDKARQAEVPVMEEGDLVLLENKFPNNKLAINFEDKPYQIIEKHGNAVIIEKRNGVKMRNMIQMKKLVQSKNEEMKNQVEDENPMVERDNAETRETDMQSAETQGMQDSQMQEINIDLLGSESPR